MKKIVLSIGFVVLASTMVVAQERENNEKPKRPLSIKQLFKELDKDKDGKISFKEVKGPLKKDFKKVDTNDDGFLSKKEIEKAPKPKRRERKLNEIKSQVID
jgi:Ca2+-binding EF-hand superfamily protein